ncbi:PAS domain-containing hybrid sensor histidine kinase/response regulator [Oceanospirillum sanctuarii]|uniref:PAS domain-containing hybrid sensor histidine kinase/response regulator n=1 Tax=Oceanospirillum sanctuarii TaxID=1434821 RepID=UPI0015935435|nr:ATP-binding protein [Oceanospirillum sanctuarii]
MFAVANTDISSEEIKLLATAFNAHQPIAIIDRSGIIIKANEAFAELTGYGLNELAGRNIRMLRSEKQGDHFYKELWLGLKDKGFWEGEMWNKTRNGDVPHHVNITAVQDDTGRFTHYVAFYEDLTTTYEHQHYLERKAQEESSLSILMALSLDSVPMHEYLGQSQARIMHHHNWQWRFLALYQPTSIGLKPQIQHGGCANNPCIKIPMTLELCQKVIDQGSPQILPMNIEDTTHCIIEQDHVAYAVPLQHAGQPSVLLLYLPERILNTTENRTFIHRIVHVLGMGINKRLTEQALIEARDKAEKASQAKSNLLSSVSHELRTPLNAILGFTQLLQDEPMEEEQKESVNEIHVAGKHLLAMVNDILDLARIESGRVRLNTEVVPLAKELESSLLLVQPLAEEHQLKLEVDLSANPDQQVLTDRVRIKQVLFNLLSNAIKYNHHGGTVKIRLQNRDKGFVRIQVIDSGIGIPEDKQQDLFEAFNRLGAESTNVEGTGIGLALCKRLAEMMHGQIGYKPNPDGGSIFWIDLPDSHPKEEPQDTASRFNILCVDDDPIHLKLLENALQSREDIRLFTENNASYAVDLAQKHPLDLILMNTDMPDLSGLEMLEILQVSPQTATIPIVAIAEDAQPETVNQHLQAGFAEYFTKPLSMDKLLLIIEQLQMEQENLIAVSSS